jgi:hypothetical protein
MSFSSGWVELTYSHPFRLDGLEPVTIDEEPGERATPFYTNPQYGFRRQV